VWLIASRLLNRRAVQVAGGLVAAMALGVSSRAAELNGLQIERLHSDDYYPPTMRRQGVTGEAFLAYSVTDRGAVDRVRVLFSDHPKLSEAAIHWLQRLRFEVPNTWKADAGPWRRFRVHVNFVLTGLPLPTKVDTGDPQVIITADFFKPGSRR
jgi:TonB family protein